MSKAAARSMFIASAVMLALTVVVPSAGAARPCVRKGEKSMRVGAVLQVTHMDKRDADWVKGDAHIYACSPKYGKRVFVGIDNDRGDITSTAVALGNSRYAAAIGGFSSGESQGPNVVRVADLKRGRIVISTGLPPVTYTLPRNLQSLALSDKGLLGLIVYDVDRPSGDRMVVRRESPGGLSETLATGPDTIGPFLEFEADQRTLRWSTSTATG